ncbi:MAG: DUF4345 domain-containing protein [Gammaproteobacteria bacterium]
MNVRQWFLLAAAAGLTPIALSYGLMPEVSLDFLFQLSVTDVNAVHIFRAVMGLYLALACFWIYGAINTELTRPALHSLVVFMFGLALGRVLSILIDGVPAALLVVYLLLELGFGAVGVLLLKRN